MTSASKDL